MTDTRHAPVEAERDSWTMRETAHLNGVKEWFGYIHQCIQQPRLSRLDRYSRTDRSVASTWRLDGEDCSSFEDAVEGLQYAPAMSLSEMDAVAQFQTREMGKRDFSDYSLVRDALRTMAQKGLVWWEAGKVQLVPNALLSAIGSAESNASGNPLHFAVQPRAHAARAAIARSHGDGQ